DSAPGQCARTVRPDSAPGQCARTVRRHTRPDTRGRARAARLAILLRMRSQPRPMPESVRLLWNTIEDHCERRTGKRRPVRAMERRTHLPSSTISDWFNYVSFPTWERFAQLLPYFTDEVFRADLEILWMAAWQ